MGRQLETIIDSLGTVTLGTLNASIDLTPVTADTGAIETDTASMEANLASLTTDVANGVTVSGTVSVAVTGGTITTGTVTAKAVAGALTRATLSAGTTMGTLFASNANRNYLLVQCTSGTAFLDTDGSAATTTGVQLTSGQGVVWESSFIPTGAVVAITSSGTAVLVGREG